MCVSHRWEMQYQRKSVRTPKFSLSSSMLLVPWMAPTSIAPKHLQNARQLKTGKDVSHRTAWWHAHLTSNSYIFTVGGRAWQLTLQCITMCDLVISLQTLAFQYVENSWYHTGEYVTTWQNGVKCIYGKYFWHAWLSTDFRQSSQSPRALQPSPCFSAECYWVDFWCFETVVQDLNTYYPSIPWRHRHIFPQH